MGKRIDLTGKRFGRWTVISESDLRDCNGNIVWNCRCDCGREKVVSGNCLRTGKSTSCGCYNHDVITKFGKSVYKEKLYSVWADMGKRGQALGKRVETRRIVTDDTQNTYRL